MTKGGNLSSIPALRRESKNSGKQLFENGIENDDAKACLEYIVRVASSDDAIKRQRTNEWLQQHRSPFDLVDGVSR